MTKLYVGNLPSEVTNDGLQHLFGYKAKRRKKTTPATRF